MSFIWMKMGCLEKTVYFCNKPIDTESSTSLLKRATAWSSSAKTEGKFKKENSCCCPGTDSARVSVVRDSALLGRNCLKLMMVKGKVKKMKQAVIWGTCRLRGVNFQHKSHSYRSTNMPRLSMETKEYSDCMGSFSKILLEDIYMGHKACFHQTMSCCSVILLWVWWDFFPHK